MRSPGPPSPESAWTSAPDPAVGSSRGFVVLTPVFGPSPGPAHAAGGAAGMAWGGGGSSLPATAASCSGDRVLVYGSRGPSRLLFRGAKAEGPARAGSLIPPRQWPAGAFWRHWVPI